LPSLVGVIPDNVGENDWSFTVTKLMRAVAEILTAPGGSQAKLANLQVGIADHGLFSEPKS